MKVSTEIFQVGEDLAPFQRVPVDHLGGLSTVELLHQTTRVHGIFEEFQVHSTLHLLVRNQSIEHLLRPLLLLNQRVVHHLTRNAHQLIPRAFDLTDRLVVEIRSTTILTSEIFVQFTREVILDRSQLFGLTHRLDLVDLVLQIFDGHRSMVCKFSKQSLDRFVRTSDRVYLLRPSHVSERMWRVFLPKFSNELLWVFDSTPDGGRDVRRVDVYDRHADVRHGQLNRIRSHVPKQFTTRSSVEQGVVGVELTPDAFSVTVDQFPSSTKITLLPNPERTQERSRPEPRQLVVVASSNEFGAHDVFVERAVVCHHRSVTVPTNERHERRDHVCERLTGRTRFFFRDAVDLCCTNLEPVWADDRVHGVDLLPIFERDGGDRKETGVFVIVEVVFRRRNKFQRSPGSLGIECHISHTYKIIGCCSISGVIGSLSRRWIVFKTFACDWDRTFLPCLYVRLNSTISRSSSCFT